MLKRLVGRMKKLAGRGQPHQSPARATPVTDDVPDDWNDVTQQRLPTKREEIATESSRTSDGNERSSATPCRVVFRGQDVSIHVASGTTVLDASLEAGIDLNHYCGGMCSCGSCRITEVDGQVSDLDDIEELTLDLVREGEKDRLACQTRVLGDVSLTLPPQDF